MSASQILWRALKAGVQLSADGDQIRFRLTHGGLDPNLKRDLKAHKAEIVARLGQGQRHALASFAQQRLWFVDQLIPHSPAYNLPAVAFRLTGTLNLGALEQALTEIVRRHESLRTTFTRVEERPAQLIAPPAPQALPIVDLQALTPTRHLRESQQLLDSLAARPFDLGTGPLFRSVLLRLDRPIAKRSRASQDVHILILTQHHIISDGWSQGVLKRELQALYNAFSNEQPSPLPDLAIQCADFAVWQRAWLRSSLPGQGSILEDQLDWWKSQLGDAPPTLELPTDRPRSAVQTLRGAVLPIRFSTRLSQALRRLTRQENATLAMTLLTGFYTLLHRVTGQRKILVGSPVAGRNRRDIEDLIGFFVNNLPLLADLSKSSDVETNGHGRLCFRELMAQVRETTLAAYGHQDLPFEKLVDRLRIERDLSRNPLFQVVFAFQNTPAEELELAGLKLQSMSSDFQSTRFDLELHLEESSSGISGFWTFDRDLFDSTTVERLTLHYQALLRAATESPARALRDLDWLSPAELHQLTVEWGDNRGAGPREDSLLELWTEQLRQRPEAIALSFQQEQLSFAELEVRAQRLAQHLRTLRAKSETSVGLCLEPSIEMVIAMLAVLKTGGTYVPLDPNFPAERLSFMQEDTGMPLVITRRDLNRRMPPAWHAGQGPLLVELDQEQAAAPDTPNPSPHADHLAYVLYTSGSTGRPKGIGVSHRAIIRLVVDTDFLQLTPSDRVAQAANPGFDAATFEIWGALLCGSRLVGIRRETALSPRELAGELARQRINAAFLTTSLFHQVAQEAPQAFAHLDHLMIGGETAMPERARQLLTSGNGPNKLLNGYGPTESTTFATCHPMSSVPESMTSVPIGRPIARTRIVIQARDGQPLPIGVPGELKIGGDGLARGYVGQPGRTAERFVPDRAAERWYRTGDLARYLSDGRVEFLGRLDHQVKIRGFRIEPGEIETALTEHPAVRGAVVVTREEPEGRRLVAYVTAARQADRAPDWTLELRRVLQHRLPDFMVPAAFVVLDELPLNANGKVDLKALPSPQAQIDSEDADDPPRTPTEELLMAIWQQVLAIDRLGIYDDFFAAGGHSLMATQVLSRVLDAFSVELPVRTLFEAPTIAELAEEVHAGLDVGRRSAPPIQPVARDQPLPLSFAQQRLWFVDQLTPGRTFYNMSGALRLRGRLRSRALEQALSEIGQRHESLRTTFTVDGTTVVQRIHPPAPHPLPRIDLSRLSAPERNAESRRLARADADHPFDLASGPLWRSALLILNPATAPHGDHVLLLSLHHIVADGWSLGILRRELATLYEAYRNHRSSPLPKLAIQYGDYAVWQRRWLAGEALESQLSWWREQLGTSPPKLQLSTDRPRPEVSNPKGAMLPIEWPTALGNKLRRVSQQQGATPAMTLLAGFFALLHRLTGQEKILVGSPVAGRNRSEIEDLIGFFVNNLPLPGDLTGENLTFRELQGRVRELMIQAYSRQDLPFEKLVQELRLERDLSRNPLFQVVFAFQNAPTPELKLTDLELRPLISGFQSTRFDLELHLWQQPSGVSGYCAFDLQLFDVTTIGRLLHQFRRLLDDAITSPDRSVRELRWLAPAAEQQVLREWNRDDAASVSYESDSVFDRFTQRAASTPDAIALAFEGEPGRPDQVISYGELRRQSRRLCHRLRCLDVGPETVVAVFTGRRPEMLVAYLGVFEAGGAYLPLDPDVPAARLEWMLRDSGASVLVTVPNFAHAIDIGDTPVVQLDPSIREAATLEGTSVPVLLRGNNAAYLIYTSGSTGLPKAVTVSHRALQFLVRWHLNAFRLTSTDRTSQVAAVGFDASVWEIWPTLSAGAPLDLPTDETRLDVGKLLNRWTAFGVTVGFLPTPLVLPATKALPSGLALRTLLTGGDRLAPITRPLPFRLVNCYGPTENTVVATVAPVSTDGTVPSIGRPIATTRAYVTDSRGGLLPTGAPGELRIAGDSLARGYLHRPARTAERFVPDLWSRQAGQRLYRTGDQVNLMASGRLDFRGRLDHQVKVRGVRIELGEIETVLDEHPVVDEAVVLLTQGTEAPRLVGCVVAADPQSSNNDLIPQLQAELRRRLPSVMVPSHLILMPSLPRNASGKLDRPALSLRIDGLANHRPQLANSFEPPGSELEHTVAEVWQDELGLDRVGVHDNFFEVGGHSLALVRVLQRLRGLTDRELNLMELFRHPTVQLQTQYLRGGAAEAPTRNRVEQKGRQRHRGRSRLASRRRRTSRHSRSHR